MTTSSTIVQRLWNYCTVLRDDGMSYGDYVERLTYLLKMDAEQALLGRESSIPAEYQWSSLLSRDGAELERHYITLLDALGKGSGLIPVSFRKAQNRIQDPAKLRRLLDLIDSETWIGLDIDVKGEIYEGLLEKNAQDTKSGAGQYFTPRPLIRDRRGAGEPRRRGSEGPWGSWNCARSAHRCGICTSMDGHNPYALHRSREINRCSYRRGLGLHLLTARAARARVYNTAGVTTRACTRRAHACHSPIAALSKVRI